MGQYKSIWTGRQIDDGIDKVRKIAYINLNGNLQEAYETAEAAYSAGLDIVARYDRNMGSGTLVQRFELLCVLRQQTKNSSQQTSTYYWFRSFVTHTSLKLAFKLGCDYGSTTATLEDITATYQWEATQETLGIQEQSNEQEAKHSISKGDYVFFGNILATADKDIAVGEALFTIGSNKNLTPVSNGGLNDLNSAISKVAVRPNLLHNWYFVGGGSQQGGGQFPINQRGQTTYSGAANTIDGWKQNANNTTTIAADGVVMKSVGATSRGFSQVIEFAPNLAGKTVTLSCLVVETDGDAIIGTTSGGNVTLSSAGLFSRTLTLANDLASFSVSGNAGANGHSVKIAAVKLELGDTQTLAHNEGTDANPVWVLNEVPDYATELLRCQRYFQVFQTEALRPTYGADFRPVMATDTPALNTITIGGVTYYTASSET